ncbi:MAG: hypothetical protein IAG10_28145 [Planctomycetaceae bacterium]|nr:hypothetical protein [Planctomycetaceae bacterium]
MQSTSEMTPTETLIENAERHRRLLRRLCWAGVAFVVAAILFAIGNPLLVRWQLRQHGWDLDDWNDSSGGLPKWVPERATRWYGRITIASVEKVPLRVSDLESLREFRQLELLYLESTHVSERHLEAISQLSSIHSLILDHVQLESAGLHHLAILTDLDLCFADMHLDDAVFENLAKCRQLTWLKLERTSFTDESLRFLSHLSMLQGLELFDCGLTNRGLDHVANCTSLVVLDINSVPITDAGVASLSRLPKLQRLDLSHCHVADEGAKLLAMGSPNLEELRLHDLPMTDAALQELARLPKLKELWITEIPITDAGILFLKSCPTLQKLILDGTQVTASGAAELRKSLPRLDVTSE